MEARIARLESDVAHLRTDVADIKVDLRSLRDKVDLMDTRLSGKLEQLAEKLASTKTWVLLVLIAHGTALLGVMARGFGWI